jgi:hypothetical protein
MGYLGFLIGKNGSAFGCKGCIGFQGFHRFGRVGAFGGLGLRHDRRCILGAYPGVMGVKPDADREQARRDSRRYAGDLADRRGDKAPKRDHNLHQCQNSTPSFRPFSSAY